MTVPVLRELAAEMDRATHAQRVRRMAELGRDDAADPSLGPLLDGLSARSPYEHELALLAAVVAGDAPRLIRALSDPVSTVRSFAFAHLDRVEVPDALLADLVRDASPADRNNLYRAITRGRRSALADRLILEVRSARGDQEAALLLPACSDDIVRALLPDLEHAVASWSALARRHPHVVLDHAEAVLPPATGRRRDRWWAILGAGLAEVSRTEPGRVLALIEAHGPRAVVPAGFGRELGRLTRLAPDRMAALVLRPAYRDHLTRWGLPTGVARNARAFAPADRAALAVALRDEHRLLAGFLEAFSPRDRATLFADAFDGIDTSTAIWPMDLLAALPHEVRQAEARRILALRPVQDSPPLTRAHLSWLWVGDARDQLDAATRVALAEERGQAFQLLAACTGRSRDADELRVTLDAFGRLRNEQDPVRAAACQGLAQVPPSIVDERHFAGIDALLTAVLEARDTSGATLAPLRSWLLALLHAHATRPDGPVFAFALASLERLAGPSGTITFGRLDRGLPRGTERRLLAALLPRLRREADHDRFELACSFARSLGERADELDELQDLLGRATAHPLDTVVRQAVPLWLRAPAHRSARVEALVRRDASFVALEPVLSTLATHRQDLLDLVLAGGTGRDRPARRLRGRFLSGNVRFVPIIHRGWRTWLPRQHRDYAAALRGLIDDPATSGWTVAAAIRVLARLPGVGLEALAPYLRSEDVLRLEAALGGLAWTDQPGAALTILLSYADGDRARVAIYAATRAARFVPSAELGAALDRLLASDTAKVTSRKEALRLLGLHRPPGALDTLVRIGAQEQLHRDLRITVGRSLRGFLDDERAWAVLDHLAGAGSDEARSLLETQPAHLAARHRARFGQVVLRVVDHPDPSARFAAFQVLPAWAFDVPGAGAAAGRCLLDLERGTAWRAAASALVAMAADGVASADLVPFVAASLQAGDAPEHDAAPERDLPRRQRLMAVLAQLAALPYDDRARLRPELDLVVAELSSAPALVGAELLIRAAAIDWHEPTTALASIADRVVVRPLAAATALDVLGSLLDRDEARWSPEDLAPFVDAATGAAAPAALVAVRITRVAGERSGWSADWRARVRTLRAHVDADVVAAAQGIVTSPE